MSKLKCWKKDRYEKGPYRASYTTWKNGNEMVSVWGLTSGKIDPNKRATASNIKVLWEVKGKKYNTRFQALKQANKYMKEHDNC